MHAHASQVARGFLDHALSLCGHALARRPSVDLALRHHTGMHNAWKVLVDGSDEAKSALDRGDYKLAENLYRSALRTSPNSPQLLANLGLTLQMEGRDGEADTC